MATSITVLELKNKIADGYDVCVFDVRRKVDYEKMPEMIAGATWQNPEKVAEWSRTIPRNQDLIVYCVKGGSVSQSVADVLEHSHPGVRFLEGGILKWQDSQ